MTAELTPAQLQEVEQLARDARINYHGIRPFLRELEQRGYLIVRRTEVTMDKSSTASY